MNKTTKRLTVVIGVIMSVAMVGSLILPLLSGQVAQSDFGTEAERPTRMPEPTFPPPPDISAIDFDATYLHPSGLFTVAAPTGWVSGSHSNTADELRASLRNAEAQSVVEARIIMNRDGLAGGEALSAYFNREWLGQTWREYWSWDETGRKVRDDGRVLIDFNLTRSRSYYIARQEAWVQDGDIYMARVITPENAARELKFLLDGVTKSMRRLEIYAEGPFEWQAYFDNADKHIVRFPAEWMVTDSAEGQPATIVSDDTTLVVESHDALLASEVEAITWMEQWRAGLQALTVEPYAVDGASGFRASYLLRTADGAQHSGVAVMLNGSDSRLHVADARVDSAGLDLLQVDAAEYPMIGALDSFRLLPELDASADIGS